MRILHVCLSMITVALAGAADPAVEAEVASWPVEEQRVYAFEEELLAIDDMAEREARMRAHFAALETPAEKIAAIGMLNSRYVYVLERPANGALAAPLMSDPDRGVRIAAAEAIAYNDAGAAYADVLRRLLAEDDVEVRCAALWAMGRSRDDSFLPDITACQADAHADVRIAASDSLRVLLVSLPQPSDLSPLLERGLDDPDPRVRWRLLQNLSPESPSNLARLHAAPRCATTTPPCARPRCGLCAREGSAAMTPCCPWPWTPMPIRYEVARGLCGDASPAAIDALRRLLVDGDPSVSMSAAGAVRTLVAEGRVPAAAFPEVSHDPPAP